MEKIKILYFVDRLKTGGIQVHIKNTMQYMDLNRFQIDFLLFDDGHIYEMEDYFRRLGCQICKVTRPQSNPVKAVMELNKFFDAHTGYSIVEAHGSSKGAIVLYFAKKHGIPCRISHSHNTKFNSENLLDRMLGNILKVANCRLATDYFACSEVAWDWLFKHWYAKKLPRHVLKPSIDVARYRYSETVRKDVRQELNLGNSLVIGNVSRFSPVKNHSFLVDVFSALLHEVPGAKLLLVGEGDLLDDTQNKCRQLGIADHVVFTGLRKDVERLVQAIDIFLMPSLYEGLPLVAIEAQAAGVPCVFSDAVTKECEILPESVFLPLCDSAEMWAEKIKKIADTYVRTDTGSVLLREGFDAKETAARLNDYYGQAAVHQSV